jgi:CheY-like chemotaxis protein
VFDLCMPVTAGDEVARRIPAKKDATKAWLMALTGWGQSNDRRRTRQAGFDHHLAKPMDIPALAALIGSPGRLPRWEPRLARAAAVMRT